MRTNASKAPETRGNPPSSGLRETPADTSLLRKGGKAEADVSAQDTPKKKTTRKR